MNSHLQILIKVILWFCFAWGIGLMLHVGFQGNSRQRKILVSSSVSRLLTFGIINGEIALIPFLFQMNAIAFLLIGLTEATLSHFSMPVWASRIWLAGVVICALLTPILSKRK